MDQRDYNDEARVDEAEARSGWVKVWKVIKALLMLAELAFGVLLFPLLFYWQGFVLADLWNLFVFPWYGIELSVFYAAGTLLAFRFCLPIGTVKDPFKKKKGMSARMNFYSRMIVQYLAGAIALAGGHIWHWLEWGLFSTPH